MTRGQLLLSTIIIAAIAGACTLIIGGVRDPWIIIATAGMNAATAAAALLKNMPQVEWTDEERTQFRALLDKERLLKQAKEGVIAPDAPK